MGTKYPMPCKKPTFTFTITTVDTPDTFRLPLVEEGGLYNFVVSWGDGSSNTITAWDQEEKTHTYATARIYTINISGTLIGWNFSMYGPDNAGKITEIKKWGCLKLINDDNGYFIYCSNLTITATDILDLTGITSIQNMFCGCTSLTAIPSINAWDFSTIINMANMFGGCTLFNQDISGWDVSTVNRMDSMFYGAIAFNQDISGWDTSSVTWMDSMFYGAIAFNQDISGWDVSSVTTMLEMFKGATAFNQDISGWVVSSVEDMRSMFYGATAFNQNIGDWDVSSVEDMDKMFYGVTLSTANYDALLIGWAAEDVNNNVKFGGGNSKYTGGGDAEDARDHLTDDLGWIITDGGIE